MRDVRLLTLYKQHYLDDYKQCMNSQITCLGYYDGLDLEKVDEEGFSSEIKVASIAKLWYSTGEKVIQLPGGYSNQNIGLFRCAKGKEQNDHTEIYWETEKRLPFFSVAFLKLKECNEYSQVSEKIERLVEWKEIESLSGGKIEKELCIILTYCTFDNSDLVVLLKGNNIAKVNDTLKKIEDFCDIIYLHSILGIEEEYLKWCWNKGEIADIWQDTKCFVGEPIKRIEIHLATCWREQLMSDIKDALDEWDIKWGIQGYHNMEYSYALGHGNINMVFTDTDVHSLLVLLLPGGFSTHQNSLYKDGIYNIETSIFVWQKPFGAIQSNGRVAVTKRTEHLDYWCRKLIEKYKGYCSNDLKKEDEGLYSYFQAMIQTLIALDQYECFTMSRDIFDLVYPSFYMFDRKIESALSIEKKHHSEIIGQVKEMICQYLECVNSIVYHTVHTDQIFLMIPGYSGTSFSIPIKLNAFYLWYIYEIMKLLNDCGKLHSCIAVPVMESSAETMVIGSDFKEEEKMILVRLSQRSLFQPRVLMVILAHEMAHYVGKKIRLRQCRMNCILKSVSYYIVEGLCPESDRWAPLQVSTSGYFMNMKASFRKLMQCRLENYFNRKKGELDNSDYYEKDIYAPLLQWCADVLEEEGEDAVVYNVIDEIKIPVSMCEDKEYVDNMRFLYKFQQYLQRNRKMLVHTGIIQQYFVKEIITLYKEVFADIVAIAVLDCEKTDYLNAFFLSADTLKEDSNIKMQQQIRKRVADIVVFNRTQRDMCQRTYKGSSLIDKRQNVSLDLWLKNNIQDYDWIYEELTNYADKCYQVIKERSEKEYSDITENIRQMYQMFRDLNYDYSQIYAKISECITKYKDLVKEYK